LKSISYSLRDDLGLS